jgi:transposase-like protein
MVLRSCDGKPIVVVDRGPWYRWALDRLGMTYFQETFGNRNRIERWFRELKDRTKRFYNNVNSKTLKSIEELVTAIAIMHNIIRAGGEEVIPTCQYRADRYCQVGHHYIHRKSVVYHFSIGGGFLRTPVSLYQ